MMVGVLFFLITGSALILLIGIAIVARSAEAERVAENVRSLTEQIEASVRDVPMLERALATNRYAVEQRASELEVAVNAIRAEVGFHALCNLHYASVQVADAWYGTYASAKASLHTIREGLARLREERDKLYNERGAARGSVRGRYHREFTQMQATARHVESVRYQLSREVELGLANLREHNARTRGLKLHIRDNCGTQGRAWFYELEARTARRQIGS